MKQGNAVPCQPGPQARARIVVTILKTTGSQHQFRLHGLVKGGQKTAVRTVVRGQQHLGAQIPARGQQTAQAATLGVAGEQGQPLAVTGQAQNQGCLVAGPGGGLLFVGGTRTRVLKFENRRFQRIERKNQEDKRW